MTQWNGIEVGSIYKMTELNGIKRNDSVMTVVVRLEPDGPWLDTVWATLLEGGELLRVRSREVPGRRFLFAAGNSVYKKVF